MPEELPVSAYLTKLSALLLKTSEAPINNERLGINKSITIEFNTKENAKKISGKLRNGEYLSRQISQIRDDIEKAEI